MPDPIDESTTGGPQGLTAADVAELLGVKRQTVYAYVSRGILSRRLAMDGRTSVFDRSEVEELRQGRGPERDGALRTMLTTRITRVADDGIWIRGHDLVTRVDGGARFTEIADLVWDAGPDEMWPVLPAESPQPTGSDVGPLDRFRVLLAETSAADPLRYDLSPRSVRAAGRRAIVAMATGLGSARPVDVVCDVDVPTTPSTALWRGLALGPASEARRQALEVALALLVDHGLAASTFAARIAASVRADPYSVIGAGLGALGGPLHGSASVAVHDLYRSAETDGDPARAVGDAIRRHGRPPGFGHSVYRVQDPRYGALMTKIVGAWSDDDRLQTVFRVREVVGERSDAIPNVDLAIGALSYLADMPANAGEAIFAVARAAGWVAHAMEEYGETPLRFRAKARYLGPEPGSES